MGPQPILPVPPPSRQVSVRRALLQFEQIPDVSVQRAQFFVRKNMGWVYLPIVIYEWLISMGGTCR